MKVTLKELAEKIEAELFCLDNIKQNQISGVNALDVAGEDEITFISDDKFLQNANNSKACAIILNKHEENLEKAQLVVKDVNVAIIETLKIFAPKLKEPVPGIDPTALIGQNVTIDQGVSIGPFVVVDDNVEIGKNSIIGSGSRIGQDTKIGCDCRIDGNVVIYYACKIGNNVRIQSNSTIGSLGFGYSFIDGAHKFIPHNGGVVIEDFVDIGANCCIDRAKFGNTIVGAGTKIDNLVQIAHNVVIGKCCLLSSQTGIAGSCKLGDGVVLAGQVGLADNIEIGAGVMVGAQSGVMRSVPAGQKLAWSPALEVKDAGRVIGQVLRLPKTAEQLKRLAKRIEKLEASEDHKG